MKAKKGGTDVNSELSTSLGQNRLGDQGKRGVEVISQFKCGGPRRLAPMTRGASTERCHLERAGDTQREPHREGWTQKPRSPHGQSGDSHPKETEEENEISEGDGTKPKFLKEGN